MQLPYMLASGLLGRILQKITEAQQPERFTQDFLGSKLGFDSGSAKAAIPFLKRLGFLASDGSPTPLYAKFRNPSERGRAVAQAMRTGYRDLFERNEYANNLSREKLTSLVVEITGLEPENAVIRAITGCFFTLNSMASFEVVEQKIDSISISKTRPTDDEDRPNFSVDRDGDKIGLNLAYTINLNLPETRDIEVFNSIFRSLRENLLKGR